MVEEKLWAIIEKSKGGKAYCKPRKQFENLIKILSKLSKDEIDALKLEWGRILSYLKVIDFERLHKDNGGLVEGGDDAFFEDFPNWIMGQGKELVQTYMEKGPKVIVEYVQANKVQQDDLTFENMGYVFHRSLAAKRNDVSISLDGLVELIKKVKGDYVINALKLSAEGAVLGYKIEYNSGRVVKGKRVRWSFDLDVDDLTSTQKSFCEEKSLGIHILVPKGDLYMTEDEIKSGVVSISLEGKKKEIAKILAGIKKWDSEYKKA